MLSPISSQAAHLVKRFSEQARLTPDKALFFEKRNDHWSGLTYAQMAERVSQLLFI